MLKNSLSLTLFLLGFFMYVRLLGGVKLPPHSKTVKNDAIELKISQKIGNHMKVRKNEKKFFSVKIFDDVSIFAAKNSQK